MHSGAFSFWILCDGFPGTKFETEGPLHFAPDVPSPVLTSASIERGNPDGCPIDLVLQVDPQTDIGYLVTLVDGDYPEGRVPEHPLAPWESSDGEIAISLATRDEHPGLLDATIEIRAVRADGAVSPPVRKVFQEPIGFIWDHVAPNARMLCLQVTGDWAVCGDT